MHTQGSWRDGRGRKARSIVSKLAAFLLLCVGAKFMLTGMIGTLRATLVVRP